MVTTGGPSSSRRETRRAAEARGGRALRGRRLVVTAAILAVTLGAVVITQLRGSSPLRTALAAPGAVLDPTSSERPTGGLTAGSTAAGSPTAGRQTVGTALASGATATAARATVGRSAPRLPAAQGGARRGVLISISSPPTASALDTIPDTYGVVVLNSWETAAAQRIKQRDPSVVVLAYQCLSSTRSSDSTTNRSGGVLYGAASPSWFATDTGGARISWDPYPGHWQMAVWNPGYQSAWTDDVVATATTGPWDGILADNDMSTLSWYSGARLAGTASPAASDAKLRAGLDALVAKAGAALNARGKLLVPNISDGRLFPGRWAAHARYGGGMEEQFAHFGTSPSGDWVGDWGSDGWTAQTAQTQGPGLSLMITPAQPGDHRTLLYGYASALVRGSGQAFWMPNTNGYSGTPTIPEMGWPLGAASGGPARLPNGAWTRTYATAWVAVNPTSSAVTVTPPGSGGTVRLDPYTATVVRTG